MQNVTLAATNNIGSRQVVRIPAGGRPNLVHDQAEKLYDMIGQGCQAARERKLALRMLLNAEELQSYLQCAFDHFAQSLDAPFDFVQAAFLSNPIPPTFGGNVLKLAITMIKSERKPDAQAIFNKLSRLIASCIMLDSVRHNILGMLKLACQLCKHVGLPPTGTADHIFPQYIDFLDTALKDFCDRYWPCEFMMRDVVPPHLQAHLSHIQFQQSMRASAILLKCVNVRSGHSAKGHQLKDGRVFAHGGYISKFSFENNRDEFHAGVYFGLQHLLDQLTSCVTRGESQHEAAHRIHRDDILSAFYQPPESRPINFQIHDVCLSCLFVPPEHALSCGHILCTACVKAYGRAKDKIRVEMLECPLEANSYGRCLPRTIYIKPDTAGIRVLSLDE